MLGSSRVKKYLQTDFISIQQMLGLGSVTGAVASSFGPGDPVMAEIGSSGLGAILLETAGDGIAHAMPIPRHWDRTNNITCRAIWAHSNTEAITTHSITFQLVIQAFQNLQRVLTDGVTTTKGAVAQAPTALASGTAVVVGNDMVFPPSSFAANTRFLYLLLTMSAFDAAFDAAKYLLGLEVEYTHRFGPGKLARSGRAYSSQD